LGRRGEEGQSGGGGGLADATFAGHEHETHVAREEPLDPGGKPSRHAPAPSVIAAFRRSE
jgi:hypothetical protein